MPKNKANLLLDGKVIQFILKVLNLWNASLKRKWLGLSYFKAKTYMPYHVQTKNKI